MEKKELQIELTPEVAEGIYANLAVISHSSSEFVADFIRILPGMPTAHVKARIVLTPEHAKRLPRRPAPGTRVPDFCRPCFDSLSRMTTFVF